MQRSTPSAGWSSTSENLNGHEVLALARQAAAAQPGSASQSLQQMQQQLLVPNQVGWGATSILAVPGLDQDSVGGPNLLSAMHGVAKGDSSVAAALSSGTDARDPGSTGEVDVRYPAGHLAGTQAPPRPSPGFRSYLQDRPPLDMGMGMPLGVQTTLAASGPSTPSMGLGLPPQTPAEAALLGSRHPMLPGVTPGMGGDPSQALLSRRFNNPVSDHASLGLDIPAQAGRNRPMASGGAGDSAGTAAGDSWFVIVIDERRRRERGFQLLEILGPMRLDSTCSAIEWRASPLADVVLFGCQTFLKTTTLPAQLALPRNQWVPVRTVRGQIKSSQQFFVMVEQEQQMVDQLYDSIPQPDESVPAIPVGKKRPGLPNEPRSSSKHTRSAAAASAGEASRQAEEKWKCDLCNLSFSSSQALGGHRINSIEHKQKVSNLRRMQEQRTQAKSDTPKEPAKTRRIRLPSMAQMPGFQRVLVAFPEEVAADLVLSQSPTAYFSSCRLDLFKRHEIFGRLGALIIERYFPECWAVFEDALRNPAALPELADAGFKPDTISEQRMEEVQVFLRMLRTKKKSLDINRRAVSKRIKGLRDGPNADDPDAELETKLGAAAGKESEPPQAVGDGAGGLDPPGMMPSAPGSAPL